METKTGGNQHESTGLRNIILTGKGGVLHRQKGRNGAWADTYSDWLKESLLCWFYLLKMKDSFHLNNIGSAKSLETQLLFFWQV